MRLIQWIMTSGAYEVADTNFEARAARLWEEMKPKFFSILNNTLESILCLNHGGDT